MPLSIRQAAKLMKKFKIADGDVVLVKSNSDLSNDENMRALAGGIKIMGHTHTIILIVDEFDDIKSVPEENMNRYGWFRINTLRKIIKQAAEEKQSEESA